MLVYYSAARVYKMSKNVVSLNNFLFISSWNNGII